MKVIGMIGGMSWESSLEYYRLVNEGVKTALGGLHSARCLMYSVEFAEIEALQHRGAWDELTDIMTDAGQRLRKGGADFILICTNTMHRMAEAVEKEAGIPLLHIADATGERIRSMNMTKVGLLGTKFTMEQDFYKGRLQEKYGIEVIIPDDRGRDVIHSIIYNELCMGTIREDSRMRYVDIINELVGRGAQGIVLGCTEIPLLVKQGDVKVPIFDTTAIHAKAAVDFALQ
ncbi:MAG: aspartate/glutamate racemase family protein [Acidobacteria bacterium]|nr:aspartate/glutamate racemase family protein [Acidobacteriota bacterium]MBU4330491.1 aspartate/glutamate racemase family protein [Acidobacteriota bacterium]MBU4494175.1 aspartate/glutamate racemase family protein [Acidobacteriota bacterium]